MADTLPENFKLRPIKPGDKVTGFDLDDDNLPLRVFLKREAKGFHASNVVRTYVVIESPERAPRQVWAFISLMCSEVKLGDDYAIKDCPRAGRYGHLSAVKIARLAVDGKLQIQGIGSDLVNFAISLALEKIMPEIGCRFLTLDSKQKSVKFYLDNGFTLLDTDDNKNAVHKVMFMDLHKLKESI